MARDRAVGAALVVGAVIGTIIYGALMFAFGRTVAIILLEITAFVAVLAILAILGWIGYVMATTPSATLEPETPSTTSTENRASVSQTDVSSNVKS